MERRNGIREALEAGDLVLGAQAATFSPTLVELYGELGLDFAWLDFEHAGPSPYDAEVLEGLTRAADAGDTDLLVRLPSGDPHLIRKVLDAGVRTLLIPRVETATEVREAVESTRFTYDGAPGGRGVGVSRASQWGGDLADHAEREDGSVLLGVMVENRTAVENIEEILSVPELGFVFVGPADLSVSLGAPLETDSETVRNHANRVVAASVEADVPVGGVADDADSARAAIGDGYRLLRIGSELTAVRDALSDRLEALR